jgi:hypothetical protein
MDYVIVVTDHAFDRIKERSGINKKAAVWLAERAYQKGLSHNETNGGLDKYISSVAGKSNKDNRIKIYGDKLFIFNLSNKQNVKEYTEKGELIIRLVTVLSLSPNLTKKANVLRSKKEQKS